MSKVSIIIALIILFLIILLKIYQIKKNKDCYKKELYHQAKKFNLFLYCLSLLIFTICLIVNTHNAESNSSLNIILNSLAIAFITMPLSINTLYLTSFKDEEKYSHIKTIVTDQYNSNLIKKFNRAGINVIILTPKKLKTKIKVISESEVDKKLLKKNIIINTSNKDLLNDLNKDFTYYEFTDLTNAYDKIYQARGLADNYIRTIKYNITTYLPLLLCYIIFNIAGFPTYSNLLLILILKVFTIIINETIYKTMPFDSDIATRKPKPTSIFIGSQEIFITIIESFCIAFTLSLPYMFTLAQGVSLNFANTIYLISFIYINLFMTYSLYSEHNILYNIFKSLKNIKIDLYVLVSIIITIGINYFTYFTTRNIGLKNYCSSVLVSIVPILIFELTKFARFTTTRKKEK